MEPLNVPWILLYLECLSLILLVLRCGKYLQLCRQVWLPSLEPLPIGQLVSFCHHRTGNRILFVLVDLLQLGVCVACLLDFPLANLVLEIEL